MCDLNFPNRLAKKGDRLILKQFPSGTMEFVEAAPVNDAGVKPKRSWRNLWGIILPAVVAGTEEPCVVCIPEGARLRLSGFPLQFQVRWGLGIEADARFIQSGDVHAHRDGVEFLDRRRVSLQELPEWLLATVLSMGEIPREISAELDYGGTLIKADAGAGLVRRRNSDLFSGLE